MLRLSRKLLMLLYPREAVLSTVKRNWLPAAIVVAAIACSFFWFTGINSIDFDSAWSGELLVSRLPLERILFHLPWRDQAHFYFMYLKFWDSILGPSLVAGRIPAVLILPVIFTQLFFLARRLGAGRYVAWLAVMAGMLSPVCLWEVRNGRMYPLVLSLILASIIAAFRFLESRHLRHLLVIALCGGVAVNLHFFAFFYEGLIGLFIAVMLFIDNPLAPRHRSSWFYILLSLILFLALGSAQIYRTWILFSDAPGVAPGWSVSSNGLELLRQVVNFLFVSTDWDSYGNLPSVIRMGFYICFFSLMAVGFYLAPRRAKIFVLIWVPFSWAIMWFFSSRLDFRVRHFIFLWPVCIYLITSGGCSFHPGNVTANGIFRSVRFLALVFVCTLAAMTLYNDSQRPRPGWKDLLPQVEALLEPNMITYYAAPGWAFAVPRHNAAGIGLKSQLAHPKDFETTDFSVLEDEIESGHDFAFVMWGGYRNVVLDKWREFLKERRYDLQRIESGGLVAEIYRRKDNSPSLNFDRLAHPPDDLDIVRHAENELIEKNFAFSKTLPLFTSYVARYWDNGFISKAELRVEDNDWPVLRHGANTVERVFEDILSSAGEKRKLFWAHPFEGGTLAVAFPDVSPGKGIRITYGLADGRNRLRGASEVNFRVYSGDARIFKAEVPEAEGWQSVVISSDQLPQGKQPLVFLVSADDVTSRFFCFGFELDKTPDAPRPMDNPDHVN